jgi:hypothetical protein
VSGLLDGTAQGFAGRDRLASQAAPIASPAAAAGTTPSADCTLANVDSTFNHPASVASSDQIGFHGRGGEQVAKQA